ncbi:PNLIP [Branchiostoma lanceolatum]|uniref:PNLIP protein n=2 Tax=Branchiostoma lanceolatum TaxID=7740 RepID=A0A8K0AAC2_BRALA|nr:PNLIP [Branchiostoma lanceolatum]
MFILPLLSIFYIVIARARGARVCYWDLGCFTDEPPYPERLPQPPEALNVQFLLYTRHNMDDPQTLTVWDVQGADTSYFNRTADTKVIIHGFIDDSDVEWLINMKDAILYREEANVILVDWAGGSQTLDYTQAASDTRVVGSELARFIIFIKYLKDYPEERFHLIGHSLGSHIAGQAGKLWKGIGRITGLDPAYPFFEGKPPEVRLDPTDAIFVDAIHTDGDATHKLAGFGMMDPVGHLDFYPNGGMDQPGCGESLFEYVRDQGVWGGGETFVVCNHLRAVLLFIESINSDCPWKAYPCSDFQPFVDGKCMTCGDVGCYSMGYDADKAYTAGSPVNIKLYMTTADSYPFCHEELHHVKLSLSKPPDCEEYKAEQLYLRLRGDNKSTENTPLLKDHLSLEHKRDNFEFIVGSRKGIGSIRGLDLRWKPYSDNILSSLGVFAEWLFASDLGTCVKLDKVRVNTAGDVNGTTTEVVCTRRDLQPDITQTFQVEEGCL